MQGREATGWWVAGVAACLMVWGAWRLFTSTPAPVAEPVVAPRVAAAPTPVAGMTPLRRSVPVPVPEPASTAPVEDSCGPNPAKPAETDQAAAEAGFIALLQRQSDPRARGLAVFFTPNADDALRVERTEQLAADALHANDPGLYAMALAACQRMPANNGTGSGACQLLSLAQWSQIDPGNGLPFIRLAAEARSRQDFSSELDAMYHASAATRFDADLGSFAALVDASMPPNTPAEERVQRLTAAFGVQNAMLAPEGRETFAFCRQVRFDPNRKQICDALATAYVDHGTSMFDRGTGTRLGTILGWDAQRLAQLAQDAVTLNAAAPELPSGTPVDCAALAKVRQFYADEGAVGQVEALRRVIARTGKPPAM